MSRWLKTTENYCLEVLESGSLKSRWQDHLPLTALLENPSLPLLASGSYQPSLTFLGW